MLLFVPHECPSAAILNRDYHHVGLAKGRFLSNWRHSKAVTLSNFPKVKISVESNQRELKNLICPIFTVIPEFVDGFFMHSSSTNGRKAMKMEAIICFMIQIEEATLNGERINNWTANITLLFYRSITLFGFIAIWAITTNGWYFHRI